MYITGFGPHIINKETLGLTIGDTYHSFKYYLIVGTNNTIYTSLP